MRALVLLVLAASTAHAAPPPPELPASVYAERRARLRARLGGCAAALKDHGAEARADSDFFYLTGLSDPGTVLLLSPQDPIFKETLLFAPRDPELEIWTGYREPMSGRLRQRYLVDYVGRIRGSTPRGLSQALRRSRCWARLRPAWTDQDAVPGDVLGKHLTAFGARTEQKWEVLEGMRAVKDDGELARMQHAAEITFAGHRAAVRALVPGTVEREVQAAIEQAFYAAGATGLAFPSIVGSAENGAVLHWTKNDRALTGEDLVVVDIGAEYGGYAADITRTFPVSGTFTSEQRQVYDLVRAVQKKVIAAVKPGVSLDALHRIGEAALLEAGHDFPHYIGHFVGLEVHDVGDRSAPLEPGMVITVEPGVYLQGRFGVRIEDMVRVTRTGAVVMSEALPADSNAVEAWMAKVRSASARAPRPPTPAPHPSR